MFEMFFAMQLLAKEEVGDVPAEFRPEIASERAGHNPIWNRSEMDLVFSCSPSISLR